MEVNVKEWTESRPQTTFSSVMLSGTNILVEFIKLVLLIVSFALDFVKPFTGTRFVIILFRISTFSLLSDHSLGMKQCRLFQFIKFLVCYFIIFRTRAGFVILSWFALMILTHFINFNELIRRIGCILHLVSSSSSSSNSTNFNFS